MTKGHYHAERETGEVYLGLAGRGYLLLQTEDERDRRARRWSAAPSPTCRRAGRTGPSTPARTPFVFFAVYPGQAGHDYAAIEESGFARRVCARPKGRRRRGGGAPRLTDAAVRAPRRGAPLRDCVVVVTPRSFGHARRRRSARSSRRRSARRATGPGRSAADAARRGGRRRRRPARRARRGERRRSSSARRGCGSSPATASASTGSTSRPPHRHGVTVTVTPGANANAVAELTVALLLALARPLVAGRDARARRRVAGAARRSSSPGRTLGLLGIGRIGSLVAAKAARASGCACSPATRSSSEAPASSSSTSRRSPPSADFLSLHAPLDRRDARHRRRRAARAHEARARCSSTPPAASSSTRHALVWALDDGPLRAARPRRAGRGAAARAATRCSGATTCSSRPHMGPHTAEATTAMGRIALEELLAVLSGRPPRFPA